MQWGNLSIFLNEVEHTVTVADHLFDVILTPREALALLGWLEENEETLKVLQPAHLPAAVPSGAGEVALESVETESELARRGIDWDAEDLDGVPLPVEYNGGR